MVDSVADMFTRIRNAYAVGKDSVVVPYSKFKMEIAKVLQKHGYVKEVNRRGKKARKSLEILLLYKNNAPVISQMRVVSKPSRRVYVSYKKIFPVRNSLGISVLSTPKGVMTGQEARRQKVGGELIAEIW
jgi:small subunit ribosomal protein S8